MGLISFPTMPVTVRKGHTATVRPTDSYAEMNDSSSFSPHGTTFAKSTRPLSALLDKGCRPFRNTPTPSDLQISSPAASSQQNFGKSNAQRDIGVLAMTYILPNNPTIQELIRLIIGVNDRDDGNVCK